MPAQRSQLVLVGGGHAHLEILRRLVLEPDSGVDVTLVSLEAHHVYSGMLPGLIAGQYRAEELSFDLRGLVERAGGRFVRDRAVGLEPSKRSVRLAGDGPLPYDWISFNVGSRLVGDDRPEIARHALLVKPLTRVHAVRDRLKKLAGSPGSKAVVIVGAGAAGVELACASRAVLSEALPERTFSVSLLDASEQILSGYSDTFRRRAGEILEAAGIGIRTGTAVAAVEEHRVVAREGESIPAELTIWLTGPASVPVFEGSGLATDKRGFLLVDDALRSVDDDRVFAVGDCATLVHAPLTPKAGVYAVRQGPILWRSLQASRNGAALPSYDPQEGFLSILNTCDGKALLQYKGWVSHSRLSWRLKDWIDRRFMRRYQGL